MNEEGKSVGDSERDILIELRSDMRHVRQSLEHFQKMDAKQWEKIDELNAKTEGHDRSIGFLSKGFWVVATALMGGVVTVGVWLINHAR